MSLTELWPQVQSLSRAGKLRVIEVLARELADSETSLIQAGQAYPIWSPDRAFEAAATMMRVLDAEKEKP
jgi:hypothetical protein